MITYVYTYHVEMETEICLVKVNKSSMRKDCSLRAARSARLSLVSIHISVCLYRFGFHTYQCMSVQIIYDLCSQGTVINIFIYTQCCVYIYIYMYTEVQYMCMYMGQRYYLVQRAGYRAWCSKFLLHDILTTFNPHLFFRYCGVLGILHMVQASVLDKAPTYQTKSQLKLTRQSPKQLDTKQQLMFTTANNRHY